LKSNEGLNFPGFGKFGLPLPCIGHNESLGWTVTNNYPDIQDVYAESFDDPSRPLTYRVWRKFQRRRPESRRRGRQPVGMIFAFGALPVDGQKRLYGVQGHSGVAVIEFGNPIHAMSIHNFGESSDPSSNHYFDQAPLYARREFKPAWFRKEEIEAHAERVYRPAD